MNKFLSLIIGSLLISVLGFSAFSQDNSKQTLSAAEKTAIINKIIELLNKNYVFPETAQKMEVFVRENLKKNEYEKITDSADFAIRLTEDLQLVSKDKHLRVTFSPNVLPPDSENLFAPSKEEIEQNRRTQSRENFGVAKLDILKGNIGLIQFNYFTSPDWAGEIYTSAMNYLSGTDALIIDLRSNAGSMHSDAVPFFLSYFFEKSVRLSDTYWRPKDETHQFWTYAQVPGKRYLNKPIYILTSRRTFSGGEELAYDMKVLKRATLIGELTGGGANGGGDQRVNDHFSVFVPIGRYVNPVTKTNWEAVGISPDIEIVSNKALYTAQLQAISEMQKTTTDADWKKSLENIRAEINEKLNNFKKVTFQLKGFENAKEVNLAGDFNSWSRRSIKMTKNGNIWTGEVELEPGKYEYKFVVDGRWIIDPDNPNKSGTGETQNSVIKIN